MSDELKARAQQLPINNAFPVYADEPLPDRCPDTCRCCVWCGQEDHPEQMVVWRDADGEGIWLHPWCRTAIGGEA